MSEVQIPAALNVSLSGLTGLAVEWFRLSAALSPGGGAPARHALGKIQEFLDQCEIEAVGFDGRPFDPGLAVRVIDVVDDPALPRGKSVIDQTLSPMVLWRGQVIRDAEVVTRRGTRGK